MKLGYSLLLGEHLDAKSIDYQDCEYFQIVCPNCREPVFKAFRSIPYPGVHYLSHYEKDESYDTDCELRVDAISVKDIQERNAISRGQRLAYFLSVLRDAILNTVLRITLWPNEEAVELINSIMASSGPQRMKNNLNAFLINETKSPIALEEIVLHPLNFWTSRGFKLSVGFALETQKRIVKDVLLHLLSAKSQANLSFLFGAAYATELHIASQAIEKGSSDTDWLRVQRGMKAMIGKGRQKADSIMMDMKKVRIGGIDLLNIIGNSVKNEMLFILWNLPYFELLKNYKDSTN